MTFQLIHAIFNVLPKMALEPPTIHKESERFSSILNSKGLEWHRLSSLVS